MTGYKAVNYQRKEMNRGSVIWVRESYINRMVKVYDPEDDDKSSEVIHLLMDTIPPTGCLSRNRKRNRRSGKCTHNPEKKGQGM